jgi:very-short-patch-repair endonuclease
VGRKKNQSPWSSQAWKLAKEQHGVITRAQLLTLGLSRNAIEHRIASGRLYPLWRGVYAVGRPTVDRRGRLMAAVLSCGPDALLSHRSAAWLWGLLEWSPRIDVVVPYGTVRRRAGIRAHRRIGLSPAERRQIDRIPVTDVATTLVDLAASAKRWELVRAVSQADRRDLIDAWNLRSAIESLSARPGLGVLRALLEEQGFAFADTLLELRFLRLARAAGLPAPQLQASLNGYRVDFYWPELGLVVETDGPRDHRTPGQQATDRRRDQTHAAAGLTPLRFTEAQVRFEQRHVQATLAEVAARLRGHRSESRDR